MIRNLATSERRQQASSSTDPTSLPADMLAILSDLQAYPDLMEHLARRLSPEVMGQLLALLIDSGRRLAIGQLRAAGLISPEKLWQGFGHAPAQLAQVLRDLAWVACDQLRSPDAKVRLRAQRDLAMIARIIEQPIDESAYSHKTIARWVETFLGKK